MPSKVTHASRPSEMLDNTMRSNVPEANDATIVRSPGDLPGSALFWTFLVALAAVALYLPAIGFELVYDSNSQILIDDFIHLPRHFLDVLTLRVMGMDVLDFNRPVNLFTLLVDSLLWGKIPAGYHFTSLLLHGATAALLFRWLLGLVGKIWPALLAALLFAVHPLHCETVVEVGYREDLLATLFLLAGLLCAMNFRPGLPKLREKVWLPALGTVACLALSVASKETGVAGPAALGVYWLLFRRNDKWRLWLALIVATAVVATAFMTVRFALEPKNSIIFDTEPSRLAPTWGALIAIQCRIFAAEFLRIAWPADLCADYNGYSIRTILLLDAAIALTLIVAGQAFLCVFGKQNRLFILATAVFWFSLAPVSNVIPIFRPMADRFLYMPLVGVALMLAAAVATLWEKTDSLAEWPEVGDRCSTGGVRYADNSGPTARSQGALPKLQAALGLETPGSARVSRAGVGVPPTRTSGLEPTEGLQTAGVKAASTREVRRGGTPVSQHAALNLLRSAAIALALAAIATLSWRTWNEERNWRDDLSLWTVTAARNPWSFNGWIGAGYAWLDRNEPMKAIDAFNHASVLAHGNRAEPWAGMALGAAALHRRPEATQCLTRAVAVDRRYAKPDSLLQALILEPARVQRLKAIATWAANTANPH